MLVKDKLLIPCQKCNSTNRVDSSKLDKPIICGSCKSEIVIPNQPIKVNESNFEKEVLKYPGVVLVDFWAEWCPPCKMLGPVLDQISKEKKGLVKIVKVNSDENPGLSNHFQISSIPTMIVFEKGKFKGRQSGFLPKPQLLQWLDQIS